MSHDHKHGGGAGLLALALVMFGAGALFAMWAIMRFAPKYPTVFCKPSQVEGGGCEPYPWRP